MLLLGIDLGTSSVKVSVVDAATHQCVATAQPACTEIISASDSGYWAVATH